MNMSCSFLLSVLSRPHSIPDSSWEQFYYDDHLDNLIQHKIATKGCMYTLVPNPMGRDPPDTHTHLVLFETEHEKPFESAGFKDVNNTSRLFPPGASTPDVSDLECRHYELLEVFDPKGLGKPGNPAPFVLQTEISIDDIEAFCQFYREDHIPMTAKHPGYRRAIMYRYINTSVVYGVTPDLDPGSVMVVHEFESFDGLGGPITKAALETKYAVRMRGAIKTMKARTLKLVCADSSQR
ncbi:hypothetical protein QQS21_004586 [Conoideocrella luteorostrata]|uniref:EthD domain-containing protein n=1 Tax=Conoideocrella luteorostrata TaxID=1105319 RepID=A0AAJ0CU63_9HYPO|nr:hypothetical protein QQS21_004586 [Conoideocrella luteorostrata]